MKKILRSRLALFALGFLVLLGTGISSNTGSASMVQECYWDVDTTFSCSEPYYDGSVATVDMTTVSGSIDYMYNDGRYPQDLVDSVNQLITDYNNGALSGSVTIDYGGYNSYAPAEYQGTYEGPREQQMQVAAADSEYMGPILAAAAKGGSGLKASFSVSGKLDRKASPVGASAEFTVTDEDVQANKLDAPGFAYGQSKLKIEKWGNTSKELKKYGLSIETKGTQADAANGTVSVKQRISLKRK